MNARRPLKSLLLIACVAALVGSFNAAGVARPPGPGIRHGAGIGSRSGFSYRPSIRIRPIFTVRPIVTVRPVVAYRPVAPAVRTYTYAAPVHRAPARRGSVRVTARCLNVRSGPGTRYPVISQVGGGAVLPVRSSSSGWLGVVFPNGGTGWISSSYTAPAY